MTPPTDQQVIEILAERDKCFMDATGGWYLRDKLNPGVCYPLVSEPSYLHSLDALQPILAGLTEEEWDRLITELSETLEFEDHSFIEFHRKMMTAKPSQLAKCIVKAIEKV